MESSRQNIIRAGMATVIVVVWVMLFPASSLPAATPVPRILVLNSYNMGYDWWEEEMAGLRESLAKAYPRYELYIEHLDTKKFSAKKHFPAEAALLEAKYAERHLDAVVAMDNAALEFALRYRQRISPGTPLVFCGINDYEPAMIAGQTSLTGVAEYHDFSGTLGLALQLHPDTRNVIVIHDYTDTGLAIRRELEKMSQLFPAVKLQFMEEMPLEETVHKLQTLTPGTLVLMLSYTVEKGGRTFTHAEAARLVSSASPVPVYSVYAAQLGKGVVGGRVMGGQIQGRRAAELAAQIIGGESPGQLPVITGNLSHPMFDYAMVKKFGINPAALPADSQIINKPASTFAINRGAVWLAGAFTLFVTVGLVLLILNIRKRRSLEKMLLLKIEQYQESQEELQATEEMLRNQVDDYIQSQDELQATEEMLREQISEYQITHDQLLATEEMLRVQLDVAEENSQKFQAVFEHSPITVALTALQDGTFSEVNQSFIDVFGYSREESIGKTSVELGVWANAADRVHYQGMIKETGLVRNFEVEMRRKNGEAFMALFSGVRLDIAGRSFILSAVMDISEQKRLQNQLYQSQKMDVVGQLAGGIAHDFNNMLAGIMAAAELLKVRLPDDEKNNKLLNTIIGATIRSADLTRELLSFSRKTPAVSSPVCIHDTIAAAMSLLERTIDRNIQLSSQLAEGSPVVMGDHTQLQSALLNLGVNARDAMPQGGRLTYATARKTLDDASCRALGLALDPGHYLEISVSDTGVGMAPEVREHIFEPFFTTKGVGKGTGLGLAAVYGTVLCHHGGISVQSEPGVGSIFRMYLPLAEDDTLLEVCDSEAVLGKGGILLVDDEEILRDVGRDLLEELGYTVFLAEDGVRAMEVFFAHRNEISLVILDRIMPNMGGKETFLQLRELDPDINVLFCSGFNSEGTGDELLRLGARGFVQKPYNRYVLSRAVAEAMER